MRTSAPSGPIRKRVGAALDKREARLLVAMSAHGIAARESANFDDMSVRARLCYPETTGRGPLPRPSPAVAMRRLACEHDRKPLRPPR